jgi:hypothetical protein
MGKRQLLRLYPLQFEFMRSVALLSEVSFVERGVRRLIMAVVFEKLEGMSEAPAQPDGAAQLFPNLAMDGFRGGFGSVHAAAR